MQPLKLLDQIPHIFHTGSQPFANLKLHLLSNIQEPLNQLPVHEPEWFYRFPFSVFEGTVGVEVETAERDDCLCHASL